MLKLWDIRTSAGQFRGSVGSTGEGWQQLARLIHPTSGKKVRSGEFISTILHRAPVLV